MLLKEHDGKRVIAVSHGGLIRAFWTVLAKKEPSYFWEWDKVANTAVTNCELNSNGNHTVTLRNCTEHLTEVNVSIE